MNQDKVKLKAQLFEYRCGDCGSSFKSPSYPPGGYSYGEFILRNSVNDKLLYLNALDDSTFSEISKIVKINPRLAGFKETERSDILQTVVGMAYDTDGGHYGIGLLPHCQICGSSKIESYEEVIPTEFVSIEVPVATSSKWNNLSLEEKTHLVDKWVESILVREG